MNGKELKEIREQLNLSQATLGDWLGVSAYAVEGWERGEIPINHPQILKLALQAIGIRLLQNNKTLEMETGGTPNINPSRPPDITPCVKCGAKAVNKMGQLDISEMSEEEIKAAKEMDKKGGFVGIRSDPNKNYVICSNLKCREYSGMYATLEEAVQVWNTVVNRIG